MGSSSETKLPGQVTKLPRLEHGNKIQKRPIPRPQQPISPRTQVIYVSSGSPFMSVVARARKHLDKQVSGRGAETKGMSLHERVRALESSSRSSEGGHEAVLVGTGKAIDRVLSLAAFFSEQADCVVEVRTRSVSAVDDVVNDDDELEDEGRVRKVSCLEATVRLR